MGILIQSNPVLSEEICFDKANSQKLLVDLEFQKKTITHQEKQISVITEQNLNLFNLSEQYRLKVDGLSKDKEIQTERANSLEQLYKDTNKDLTKCKNNTTSRFNWFGIGFVTAVIVGTAAAFAIAR